MPPLLELSSPVPLYHQLERALAERIAAGTYGDGLPGELQLVAEFGAFDVVLSDLAPQTTGDRLMDQYRSEVLTGRALDLARGVLRPGGHFAAKVFVGGGFKALLDEVKGAFGEVKSYHPKATRAGSTEQYIVGRGLKGGAAIVVPRDATAG